MKNYLLLFFAALFISCTSTGVQVTFDDEKSNAIRAHYQNYLDQNMDGLKSLWSPDIKIFLNSRNAITQDDLIPLLEAQHATYDITMTFGEEGGSDLGPWVETTTYPAVAEYPEAIITQTWFTWNATSKLSGNTINLPAHIGFKWGDDGRIIEEYHHYDTVEMTAGIEEAQAAAATE
tara:strand:+ start:40 stop:570 length:531 start_codon:yes stop_codon:yes gene_type:complete